VTAEPATAPAILVVDDDPLVIAETREVLAAFQDAKMLAAHTLAEARQLLRRHRVMLAIIDLALPDGNGLELVAELSSDAGPGPPGRVPTRCLVRTVFDDDDQVLRALAAGAQGYLVKGEEVPVTRQRLAAVLRGEPVVSPAIARRLLQELVGRGRAGLPADGAPSSDDPLTTRERDVLTRIATGMTVIEVADALGVSENTVKTHLKGVYRKLGVRTRAGVITAARDRGLL
jgi:DNA-binding NarL/FixJ family response regulator